MQENVREVIAARTDAVQSVSSINDNQVSGVQFATWKVEKLQARFGLSRPA